MINFLLKKINNGSQKNSSKNHLFDIFFKNQKLFFEIKNHFMKFNKDYMIDCKNFSLDQVKIQNSINHLIEEINLKKIQNMCISLNHNEILKTVSFSLEKNTKQTYSILFLGFENFEGNISKKEVEKTHLVNGWYFLVESE